MSMTDMTWSNSERLYNLLPAIYRTRDHQQGEPLRALLSVIQSELETLEADIEGLYDNWFVETAAEWLIPYIGDLLGVRNLHTVDSAGIYSLRAYVANTLLYRQRKGTAAVLEQLADDITGWEARVVEFFQLLGTTQHLNHVRLDNMRTPDLRNSNKLELLDSPFDKTAHTGEVRRIATHQGRYNIPNVGLFLWRLQSYFLQRTHPRADGASTRRFYFNPIGLVTPIFNRPKAEPDISHIATELNVPTPVRRRAMYENPIAYLGTREPVLQVIFDNAADPLSVDEIRVCDLSEWDPPTTDGTALVAVDPELGRLALLDGVSPPSSLEVSYTYGFSSDVGGGPYDRNDSLAERDANPVDRWVARVDQAGGPNIFTTLTDAVTDWNAQAPGTRGVIAITDSLAYAENLTGANTILLPTGSELVIVAARPFDPTVTSRLDARGVRPHLLGNLSVDGASPAGEENPGELILNGLLIEGQVRVRQGNLGRLTIKHCTLVPLPNSLIAPSNTNTRLHVTLERSICGGIILEDNIPHLTIIESIVDNADGDDIIAPGAEVVINCSTIFGSDDPVDTPTIRVLHASESIFTGRLIVERRQVGCVRFCHVSPDSRTPRRYRCQPDLTLDGCTDPTKTRPIIIGMRPQFTSTSFGHPGYCQLSQTCAIEIRTGAEDGAEMGVFNHLKQPQREANLRIALEEYLPFGLQAGIFYVT